jgi:hypothetical protein
MAPAATGTSIAVINADASSFFVVNMCSHCS